MLGQFLVAPTHNRAEILLLECTADAVAVESVAVLALDRFEAAAGLATQIFVLRALDHAEESLIGLVGAFGGELLVFVDATDRPRLCALDRSLLVAAGVEQRSEFVEREHDVGAELMLDLHRHLGGEAMLAAVEVRFET